MIKMITLALLIKRFVDTFWISESVWYPAEHILNTFFTTLTVQYGTAHLAAQSLGTLYTCAS